MYYPFLRGKLFELLAIRELAESNSLRNIVPIIEPVQDNYSALNKATELLEQNNQKYIFIYKTNVGGLKSIDDYTKLVENTYIGKNQIPGFIIDNNNDDLIGELIKKFESDSIALFHFENTQNIEVFYDGRSEANCYNFLHLDRLGPFALRRFRQFSNNIMQ